MADQKLAKILYEMADLLEIKGTPFKPGAYKKAAASIENLKKDVSLIYKSGGTKELTEIPGVGKSIAKKIEEYLKKGKIKSYEELKKETAIRQIITHYFKSKGLSLYQLKGDAKKKKIIYSRYTKPAKQLLELAGSVDNAKHAIDKISKWALSRNLDYAIETVFKKWLELDKLKPKDIVKKPFYDEMPMIWSEPRKKWFVINDTGEWLEFAGKKSDIKWKMIKIVQKGDPILYSPAKEVPVKEIGSAKIKKVIRDMSAALHNSSTGVGIAAPQIGVSLAIFLVSEEAMRNNLNKEEIKNKNWKHLVFISPKLIKSSKKKELFTEGCLSVDGVFGKIKRSRQVTVEAYNESGEKFRVGASGLYAQVLQHELDHLNGILFVDKAEYLEKADSVEGGIINNIHPVRGQKNIQTKEIQALSKLIREPSNGVKKPRIVFLGTPEFAVSILESLKDTDFLPMLIITSPDAKKGRGMKITPPPAKIWAEKNNIDVVQPDKLKDKKLLDTLNKLSPDLFIVASYGKIMPKELLDIPKSGTINVHPSLLPKHRGASPIISAILNGDKETGVTIMLVDEEMDHGSILAQRELEFPISNFQFLKLEKKLTELGGQLLIETIPEWFAGKIIPKEQNHKHATYTKKVAKEDGHIDWSKPAEEIERRIRALNPWPGTFTFHNQKRLIIRNIEILKDNQNKKPGEVFLLDNKFTVACGVGAVLVKRLQTEGKKEMDSKDFLRGNKDLIGSRLY